MVGGVRLDKGEHRRGGYIHGQQPGFDLRPAQKDGGGGDGLYQMILVGHPGGVILEAGIVHPLGMIQRSA